MLILVLSSPTRGILLRYLRISEYIGYHLLGARQAQVTPRPYLAQCLWYDKKSGEERLTDRQAASQLVEQPHGTLMQTYTHTRTIDTFGKFLVQTLHA